LREVPFSDGIWDSAADSVHGMAWVVLVTAHHGPTATEGTGRVVTKLAERDAHAVDHL
jgi:hypothetical protein